MAARSGMEAGSSRKSGKDDTLFAGPGGVAGRKVKVVGGKLKLRNVKKEKREANAREKRAKAVEEDLDQRVKAKSDRYCKQT